MLEMKDLCVSYEKHQVIKGVTASFEALSCYGILGKSGSGKTTLAKAVASILPFEGEILWEGKPLDRHKHHIAWLPQNHGLIPWKTVAENIALPLKSMGIYEGKALQAMAEELGIDHLLKAYPNQISGGEKQRVSMARGFLARPQVLLLDEAFSALDSLTAEEAHAVFLKTFAKHKVTTLLITHNVEEALKLAQTLCIFKEGKIVKTMKNPFYGREKEEDLRAFLALQKEIKEAL